MSRGQNWPDKDSSLIHWTSFENVEGTLFLCTFTCIFGGLTAFTPDKYLPRGHYFSTKVLKIDKSMNKQKVLLLQDSLCNEQPGLFL